MGQISRSSGSGRSTGSGHGSFGCELAVSEIGRTSPAAARAARRFLSHGALLALLAGMSMPLHVAMAQENGASAPESEEQPARSQLEEMTVTASRNEESVKDVPISVTTVPQQQIEALSSDGSDIRNLSGSTPSLVVESSNGRSLPRFLSLIHI